MNGDSMLALLRVVFYIFAGLGVGLFLIGIVIAMDSHDYGPPAVGVAVALACAFLGAISGAVDDIRSAARAIADKVETRIYVGGTRRYTESDAERALRATAYVDQQKARG